jgi:CDP-4-dehydro-6-deoxyglucose reductase, E1
MVVILKVYIKIINFKNIMEVKLIKKTFFKEDDTQKKLAEFVQNAKFLSMNKECASFEDNFSKWQGRKYSIFFNSGSSANLALLQSLLNLGSLKKGDAVGFSSLTWATNVMPIIQLGLKPVAIDSNLETLNVSLEKLKESSDIKCFFITNALGFSDDLDAIRDYCNENSILFLEDNCESLGSRCGGVLLGNFGMASTFSFFVGHHMSTIEGGMVCTDDKELHDMLKMVRSHGWDRHLDKEKKDKLHAENIIDNFYAPYTFYDLAFNLRPTEISGFLGNIQLQYLDEIISKRRDNYNFFVEILKGNDDVIQSNLDHMDFVSSFAIPLIFKDKEKFERYKNKFLESGIEIRPIIAGNINKQPFYKKYVKDQTECPACDFIHENGFYFGNNPDLTQEELNYISELLKK